MKPIIILFSFLSSFFSLFAQSDSIRLRNERTRLENQKRAVLRADSAKLRADIVRFKADSIRYKTTIQRKFAYSRRDSAGTKYYSGNFVYDYYDKDTLTKEITTEVACSPDATIFVENLYRKLIVKTSTDNKVKLVTTVNYSADSKLTDAEWFEQLNLELKSNNNQVVLKSDNNQVVLKADNVRWNGGLKAFNIAGQSNLTTGSMTLTVDTLKRPDNPPPPPKAFTITGQSSVSSAQGATTIKKDGEFFSAQPMAIFDGDGNWVNKRSNTQRVVTIYIPAGAKLDVESKYADVEIQNDLKSIKADISNASLRFANADKVDIQGKYININAGNIKTANVEISNGKFYSKDINSARFNSKYSSIEFGATNNLKLESINDQYEIDEVTDLTGKKNYGNIRITNLKNSFDLTGNNADIKIRDIAATVTSIKINDKYADIRLPLDNLSNYSVDFDGKNCNVYAPFDKIVVLKTDESPKKTEPSQVDKVVVGYPSKLAPLTKAGYVLNSEGKDNSFKSSVGDIKGKHAELLFKCTSCTVDFK